MEATQERTCLAHSHRSRILTRGAIGRPLFSLTSLKRRWDETEKSSIIAFAVTGGDTIEVIEEPDAIVRGNDMPRGKRPRPESVLRCWIVRKHARHWWQIADAAVDHAEHRDDRGLVGGDAVEVAHISAGSVYCAIRRAACLSTDNCLHSAESSSSSLPSRTRVSWRVHAPVGVPPER